MGALAATGALVAGSLVVLTAVPATATTVSDEASFRTAWADASETSITLSADVTLSNCGAGVPTRASATALTLTGNGHTITQTCAGQGVLHGTGGGLTLGGVTITGGTASGPGGGVFAQGAVTLTNSTITGNTAGANAGGLTVVGPVTLTNSTVSGNTGPDGGIFANGSVTVTNSTVSGNHGSGGSGGIGANPGPVTLINSTVSGNTGDSGGGVFVEQGLTLVYSTVVSNTSANGANLFVDFGDLTSFGSVVALPQGSGANCSIVRGATTSNGFNFSDDASCGFTQSTDHQNAGSPGLGALANNGGATLTQLPQSGSPLIDAIATASCQADGASGIATDQRGITRPQGAGCDIGAVEAAVAVPISSTTTSTATSAQSATPVNVTPAFTG
jgi:hypothetical protein